MLCSLQPAVQEEGKGELSYLTKLNNKEVLSAQTACFRRTIVPCCYINREIQARLVFDLCCACCGFKQLHYHCEGRSSASVIGMGLTCSILMSSSETQTHSLHQGYCRNSIDLLAGPG